MFIAHQGGWDEALFVIVPLVLFAYLLRKAQRRAERESAGGVERGGPDAERTDPPA